VVSEMRTAVRRLSADVAEGFDVVNVSQADHVRIVHQSPEWAEQRIAARRHPLTKAERAEQIARLISRVRRRNYSTAADWWAAYGDGSADWETMVRQLAWVENFADLVVQIGEEGPTIDITPLWNAVEGKSIQVDECECLFSPWPQGSMFSVNPDGVGAVGTWFWSTTREDYDDAKMQHLTSRVPQGIGLGVAKTWDDVMWSGDEGLREIWDEIAQVVQAMTWYSGGGSDGSGFAVLGPVWSLGLAIDYDGKVRSLQTLRFMPESAMGADLLESDLALLVRTLDFLNLRNIEVAEMSGLPRPTRRRLARQDVTIRAFTILPMGRYRRSARDRTVVGDGVPFTPVRGHIIRSGVEGRRHLFGNPNVTGRFWVPAHARGSREHGEVVQEFTLEPGGE